MLTSDTILQNRYRVIRPLGRGGMGAVYEAFDERLSRTVALKETLVETDELRRAFGREARLLANLRHPVLPRDIKPSNLKVVSPGHVVLLDFGLAKGSAGQMMATGGASLLGYSPAYSPLEQMQGTGTDERSDLYSLAATLYHLLTGASPPDALSRATALVNGRPDPLRPPQQPK